MSPATSQGDPTVALEGSTAQMVPFPQEINDQIVDAAQDDHEVLRALGLVSRSWCERTREYLFHSVSLDAGDTSANGTGQALALLMNERPTIRNYIRDLSIGVKETPSPPPDAPGTVDEGVATVLPLLSSITALSITGKDDEVISTWESIPSLVRDRLLDLALRAKIQYLHVTDIADIPIMLFLHLPHLQDLTLWSVSALYIDQTAFRHSLSPVNNLPWPYPSIKTLDTYNSHVLAFALFWPHASQDGPRSKITLSQLHDLTIYTDFDDEKEGKAWFALLNRCPQIEKYTIVQDSKYPPTRHFPLSVLYLKRFSNLQEVSLTWYYTVVPPDGGFDHNPFPKFIDGLAHLGDGNHLRRVEICVRCEHYNELMFNFCTIPMPGQPRSIVQTCLFDKSWAKLDWVLSRPVFSQLAEIHVHWVSPRHPFHDAEHEVYLRQAMGRTIAAGVRVSSSIENMRNPKKDDLLSFF
ncbi:hypothetical protein D9611_009050 [Ephemerocybe angulata]|uniref:Uncharacterized protein n=1 Tax=Ephemerocybe angulata TaxID=980116 RepID=A0A8H5CDI6_9AGAR|nr:hypothetical protein D9611_009050 [Tulosesus angulatus]